MNLKAPAIIATALALTLSTGVAYAAGDRDLRRLAGDSRYTTAVAISQEAFPNGAHSVYLARADSFADALAAASLTDRGPILLVPQCGTVPREVIAEADRLQPVEVVALGGQSAVCDQVLQQFQGSTGDAAPGEDIVTVNGPGDQNSDPFMLKGGDYNVTYDFSGSGCSYHAFLGKTVDGQPVESIGGGDGPTQGETNLYDLAPAEYYIDLIATDAANCPWTITFTSR